MRAVSVIILFLLSFGVRATETSYTIRGQLKITESCREGKAMVWLP